MSPLPTPMLVTWPGRFGRTLLASIRAWIRHRAQSKGAALAFYTLFSLAPILVLAMAVAGRVLGRQAVRGDLFLQLKDLLGAHLAQAAQSLVLDAQVPGSGRLATVIASVILVLAATSVFAELKDSLDELWQQQTPVPMGFLAVLRTRLLAFALVLVLTVLVLLSLAFNALLGLLESRWSGPLPPAVILSPLFSFVVLTSLFAVTNKMLPAARISWRDAAAGALFTALLFTLGRRLIWLYLSHSAVSSSFGAAGSLAALLVWVYYSAQIFFLGAEFTREFALEFGSLRQEPKA